MAQFLLVFSESVKTGFINFFKKLQTDLNFFAAVVGVHVAFLKFP